MNHLKHMFAFNVPRRVPSNAAIPTPNGPQTKTCFKRRQSKPRLLKSDRSISLRPKRSYDFKDVQRTGQQDNRDGMRFVEGKGGMAYYDQRFRAKTTVTCSRRQPLERNVSIECVQRQSNRYPVTQAMRFSTDTNKRYNRADTDGLTERRSSKDLTTSKDISAGTLLETEQRSYAQMIADYSETLYVRSSSGIFSDSSVSNAGYRMCRSPFSTLSAMTARDKSVENKSGILRKGSPNAFNQAPRFSRKNSCTRYDCRTGHRNFVEPLKRGSSEGTAGSLERIAPSYAKMIAKYSDALNFRTSTDVSRNAIPPRRSFETFGNPTTTVCQSRDGNDTVGETGTKGKESSTLENRNNEGHSVEPKKQVDWVKRFENVVTDLRRVSVSKDAKEIANKLKEKQSLYSINEYAHWLDRVVSAHRRRYRDSETVLTKMSEVQQLNEGEKNKVFSEKFENNNVQQLSNYGKSPSSSSQQHSNRVPINPGAPSKNNLTQTPAKVAPNSSRVPRVELKMSPSQNESVVSINVDEVLHDPAGNSNRDMKELSVIVRSSRSKRSKSEKNKSPNASAFTMQQNAKTVQPSAQSKFGSMHISITEDSVPVKQIQFSINGKPISDLKSIVARADKLDVVSSLDKVEIRIPFSEKSTVASGKSTKGLAKSARGAEPVLNLQISAKFDEPRAERTAETYLGAETKNLGGFKRTGTLNTQNVFKVPGNVDVKKGGSNHQSVNQRTDVIKENVVANTEYPMKVTKTQKLDSSVLSVKSNDINQNIQQSTDPMKSSENLGSSRSEIPNNGYALKSTEINIPAKKSPSKSSVDVDKHNNRERDDQRAPSNMIPWWSSEDSFNKIRKKGNTQKALPASPTATEETIKPAERMEKPASAIQPQKPERVADPKPADGSTETSMTSSPHAEMNLTTENTKQGNEKFTGFSRSELLKMTRGQRLRKWEHVRPIASNSRVSKQKTKQQNRLSISELVKTELQQASSNVDSNGKDFKRKEITETAGNRKSASDTEVKRNSTSQNVPNELETENVNESNKNDSNTALKSATWKNVSESDLKNSDVISRNTVRNLRQSPRSLNKLKDINSIKSNEGRLTGSAEKITAVLIAVPQMKPNTKEQQKPIGETTLKNAPNYLPNQEVVENNSDTCSRVKTYSIPTGRSLNDGMENVEKAGVDFRNAKDAVGSHEKTPSISTKAETKNKSAAESGAEHIAVSISENIKPNKETEEENLSKNGRSIEGTSSTNLRIKDIVECMKPIEKRQDGTLIDYGVKVPTRKTPHSHDSKPHQDRGELPVNLEVRRVTSNTLTQPKNMSREVKQIEMDDTRESTLQHKTKRTVSLSRTHSEKRVNEAATKENNSSKISSSMSPRDRSSFQKTSLPRDIETTKHNIEISSPNFSKEPSKTSESRVQDKTPQKGAVCKNSPLKSNPTNNNAASSFAKATDSSKHVKTQNSSSAQHSESISSKEIMTSSIAQTTDKKQKSRRDSRSFNVFNSSPTSRQPSFRKLPKSKKTEKTLLEGSTPYPFRYVTDKKTSNTDVPPLGGTVISQGSKAPNNKGGSQKAPPVVSATSQSVRVLSKDMSSTGMAPLAGTVVHQPSKETGELVSELRQERQRNEALSMDTRQNSVPSTSHTDKMKLSGNSVDLLESGSSYVPTGPAGLKPNSVGSRITFKANLSNKVASPIRSTASKQQSNKKSLNRHDTATKTKSTDAADAQRFATNVDDDEIPRGNPQ